MVKIKLRSLKKTSKNLRKVGFAIGGSLMITGLVSCGGETEYETTEVLTPSQGIVTEVKEVESNLFKIMNEEIVGSPDSSRIIAEYMGGTRDTFTLDEARLVNADNPQRSNSMRGVLMGGLMGYMMGKSMSTPVSRSAYGNNSAYQKSNTSTSTMRSTATRRTVRTPKSGFGGSKSTRSSGG